MQAITLHNKTELATFLRQDVFLHLYSLGDLDDFFWPYTTWYGLKSGNQLVAVILFYTAQPLPIILALSAQIEPMADLLAAALPFLPPRFYAHLSPGLEPVLSPRFALESWGAHYKMALTDPTPLVQVDVSRVIPLSAAHLDEITSLYRASYPENWFDRRMLETNQYFGLPGQAGLLSIAGVHVYSETYRVAALGNITTHPAYRGRQLGRMVTAKLCRSLAGRIDHIGLNVKADNRPAINLYQKLGFEITHSYGEYMVTLSP